MQVYFDKTAPLNTQRPAPETYVSEAVKRLREFDLTKTEVYSIINLSIGLPTPPDSFNEDSQAMEVDGQEEADVNGDEAVAELSVPAEGDGTASATEIEDGAEGRYLLGTVVDGLEERFPGEQGEEKIQAILRVLRECISKPVADARNGDAADQTSVNIASGR